MMNAILDFLIQYDYIVGVVALVAAFFLVKHFAKGHARLVALDYLSKTQGMIFHNADAKIAFVCEAAYNVLPMRIKLLVPRALFTLIVLEAYDGVKNLIQHDDTPVEQPKVPEPKPTVPVVPVEEHARKQG